MIKIKGSQNIKGIDYDENSKEMTIQFTSGGLYSYQNVPKSIYGKFLKAKSKGSFFADYVKNVYEYERLK